MRSWCFGNYFFFEVKLLLKVHVRVDIWWLGYSIGVIIVWTKRLPCNINKTINYQGPNSSLWGVQWSLQCSSLFTISTTFGTITIFTTSTCLSPSLIPSRRAVTDASVVAVVSIYATSTVSSTKKVLREVKCTFRRRRLLGDLLERLPCVIVYNPNLEIPRALLHK